MVISPNLIRILIGWDGLGLVSYCLVIYFQNFKSYSAGMLTILANRIGDVAILLSISWILNYGLSLITITMAGLRANVEYDLRKVIALSTLRQLGLIMSILFLGFPILAFLHLLTHAFFMALLFMCAGVIIHCINDSQDMRHIGGIINNLPFTCACFCISNLSLCGFPFIAGFYSKDIIIEIITSSMGS
uniref:NADH:ubiquinone reductase (H(+)-translocating) n=3 Tax=Rhodnius prolixus TaxID=13249 RepID=T1HY77_RHOPR